MAAMSIHSVKTAPEGSRAVLEQVQASIGVIPNLAGGMAEAPTLVRGFFTLREIYSQGSLTAQDIQILSLANARENGCNWCVAFHSWAAVASGVAREEVEAVRAGESPANTRWRALCQFTSALIQNRGSVSSKARQEFTEAGFTEAQALEVVLGIGFSVLANYAGHLIDPALEPMLAPYAWTAQHPRMQKEKVS